MRRMRDDDAQSIDLALPLDMAAAQLHEICNQITTLRAYTELAQEMTDDDAGVTQYLQNMTHSMDDLENMLREVLCVAREDPATYETREEGREPDDLVQTVEEVVECLRPRIVRKEICVDLTVRPRKLEIESGKGPWIRRILYNLVDNAVAVSPSGGRVDILCKWNSCCDLLYISVEDEGPGIPEDMREAVFRPFITTKPNGTGLGLFLARRMARERLNGELCLHSNGDAGTSFVLSLPSGVLAQSQPHKTSCCTLQGN